MPRPLALALVLASVLLVERAEAGHGHGCAWGGFASGVSFGPGIGGGWYGGYWPRPYRGYFGSECFDPYGIYYSPYSGYSSYYLPPVFAPAELLYGPRAVQQFWGNPLPPLIVRPSDRSANAERTVRHSNPEYRRKADQFLAQGDRLFGEQKYSQALDRYKQAAALAPDLAEPQWRKGHAYVAVRRYELAAAAFKRALAIDSDVSRDGFALARLYGLGRVAKASHLESLAGETLVRSDSADLYFLLGVFLRYDGQPERAEKFFVRAAELAGGDAAYLAEFLPPVGGVPVAVRELET